MEMEEESDFIGSAHGSRAKRKEKNRSKDLKSALKAKRKVANFMERVTPPGGQGAVNEEEHELSSDDLEVLFDDENMRGEEAEEEGSVEEMDDMANVTLEGLTFVSNDDTVEIEDDDSDPGEDLNLSSLPHMREFDRGIQYRKLNCNSVLVSIEPFKKLNFFGKALVQVLKGVVDIYGYRLTVDSKKYTVFSCKGHSSLVSISGISRSSGSAGGASDAQLESCGLSSDELASSPGALIIMEGFENEWCDGMRSTYPEATEMIGPSISGIGPGRLPPPKNFLEKLGFQFVKGSSSIVEKSKLLDFPSYWDDIFNDLTNQFDCDSGGRICPFGGKGVGKSTFVRWLTNRYLSRRQSGSGTREVLFIDLDPGQTEFTPPGMISAHVCTEPILGPNFTHLKDPVRAVYLGTISIADLPVSYIKGVAELFEFCESNERFQGIPWILNTMGFSQGLGVHLACEIVKIFRPNCVIQLNIDNAKRCFPFFLNKENVSSHKTFLSSRLPPKYQRPLEDYTFLSVKSACDKNRKQNMMVWGLNARLSREMVLISYFAEKIGLAEGFNFKSVVPLKVPLDSVAIGTPNSDLSYSEIITTLNGNLVALCEMSPEIPFKSTDASPSSPSKKFITKAADYTNNCLGYGIVRAYDKQSETLFVVTPVSETDILLKVNVILAAGPIGLPIHFYVNPAEITNNSAMEVETPYLMNRKGAVSRLHFATKKFYVPKRVTHNVLKNCLL